ncbi:hypothetical protein O6H91_11G061900 [Diphasiastrum complanatum]|uniref:Uncharacterized protein n=1 Tax=Diphasiastrum complanatum TaxID=34168 RepID=A0ACC2C9N2_DIPCM|nr:hypothetical protein O6H91_11G061900 [Diphasiastrum complanatum]
MAMAAHQKAPVLSFSSAVSAAPPPSSPCPPTPTPTPTHASFSSSSQGMGIKTVVVDANAIIEGLNLAKYLAHQISTVTVTEVLEEVRDPRARAHLASLPFDIKCVEPEEEAIQKVIQFARATGDIQSLSKVDIKVIALAYTLEAQIHGTAHIRSQPPPTLYNPVHQRREKDPLGWGSNVPNPEEWVQFPEEGEGDEEQPDPTSHILGLKDLNIENKSDCRSDGGMTVDGVENFNYARKPDSFEVGRPVVPYSEEPLGPDENLSTQDAISEATHSFDSASKVGNVSEGAKDVEKLSHQGKSFHERLGQRNTHIRKGSRARNYPVKSVVPVPEGKSMVSAGIDASRGELEDVPDVEWEKAMSRSTRRKHIKKALNLKDAANGSLANITHDFESFSTSQGHDEQESLDSGDAIQAYPGTYKNISSFEAHHKDQHLAEAHTHNSGTEDVFHGFAHGAKCIENVSDSDHNQEKALREMVTQEDFDKSISMVCNGDEHISGESGSLGDELESEPSGMLAPLWSSSIACLTTDYAMQNVILQMGLRLLSPTGVQVRELHRWMLKCHACGQVTRQVGRIFCPRCGNGGTLYKVSVTVGANGCIQGGRSRRVNLRGTRYSLPMPKGGREGASLNPILREDQLPQRLLYPKVKKGSSAAVLEGLSFSEYSYKGAEKKFETILPVREATAIFSGRRNPNDKRMGRRH